MNQSKTKEAGQPSAMGLNGIPSGVRGAMRRILAVPGVHFLLTRFGPSRLRRLSFDQKFLDGQWRFNEEPSSELVRVVEKYAAGGPILMLGCGTGGIVRALRPDSFESLVGVDLSPVAIAAASRMGNERVRFETGDMLRYPLERSHSVILMSESLYYVNARQRMPLLQRLTGGLTPGGRVIVTISQAGRYARLLNAIRREFSVDEDRAIGPRGRRMMVFRNQEGAESHPVGGADGTPARRADAGGKTVNVSCVRQSIAYRERRQRW